MGFELTDGTGKGYSAKIDSRNRLSTDSTNISQYEDASREGFSYVINSGYVSLTSSNTTSAVLFVKNDGDRDLAMVRFQLSARDSVGATQTHGRFIFYRNPGGMTGGAGTSATALNLNFGSSNALDVSTEVGRNLATFTTLTPFNSPVVRLQEITLLESAVVVPKGSSIGVSFTTPDGNTSLEVAVGINIHEILSDN